MAIYFPSRSGGGAGREDAPAQVPDIWPWSGGDLGPGGREELAPRCPLSVIQRMYGLRYDIGIRHFTLLTLRYRYGERIRSPAGGAPQTDISPERRYFMKKWSSLPLALALAARQEAWSARRPPRRPPSQPSPRRPPRLRPLPHLRPRPRLRRSLGPGSTAARRSIAWTAPC